MTLVVAAISGDLIWMIGDTAITGGRIDLRSREYLPKIEPSKQRTALIGFAGGAELARTLVRQAAAQSDPAKAIELLANGSVGAEVEFAFGHIGPSGPMLFHIRDGSAVTTQTLHLGVHQAFESLQKIRLGEATPYAPLALKTFMCGARVGVPEQCAQTIRCMIDLFASREEHDVGGWPVAYLIDKDGLYFCGYCYGVSDPLFDRLTSGSVVPHGTAAEGGSTLSVSEIGNVDGMTVYWLQNESGRTFVRTGDGYDVKSFYGGPTLFKQVASFALGVPVDLWVGDQPPGPVKELKILRDRQGNINCVIADHGNSISLAVHNLATPFDSKAEMLMAKGQAQMASDVGIVVSAEKNAVRVSVADGVGHLDLSAEQLDDLIFKLGEARAELSPPVAADFPEAGKIAAQINPRWCTNPSPHPSIPGVLLRLRHSGLGWLGFVFPPNEAISLGRWLSENPGNNGQ